MDIEDIVRSTDGFSGADVNNLCRHVKRSFISRNVNNMKVHFVIENIDFRKALSEVKSTVPKKDLPKYCRFHDRE